MTPDALAAAMREQADLHDRGGNYEHVRGQDAAAQQAWAHAAQLREYAAQAERMAS